MHSTGVIFLYILKYCLSREHCDVEILYKFIHKMGDGPGNTEGAGERTLKFTSRK